MAPRSCYRRKCEQREREKDANGNQKPRKGKTIYVSNHVEQAPWGAAGWAKLGRQPAPERESRQAYTEIPVPYIQPLLAEQQN